MAEATIIATVALVTERAPFESPVWPVNVPFCGGNTLFCGGIRAEIA